MGGDLQPVTFATRMNPQQRVQLAAWPPQRPVPVIMVGPAGPGRMAPTRDAAGSKCHTCCGEGLRFSDHTLRTSFPSERQDNNGPFLGSDCPLVARHAEKSFAYLFAASEITLSINTSHLEYLV